MGGSKLSYSIFSVLLVISVLWKPAFTDDKCSEGCKGSPSAPTFLTGHKYNYAVEGIVSVYLTGADKQETSVKLLGQVSVSALGNCAHVLKVQNLVISGPDGKKYNKPNGMEKPVRFTLQDGKIGSEICAEEGDTRRSLNIKRAIISLLQTEQKSSTQVDIFGTCPTDAFSSQEGGAVLVHRTRDLSRCGHREQGKNDLITAVYNPSAEIKDTQVLQSSLNVESKVNNGVPEKVAAIEEYLYKPFSVGENGARAKVHTKLTLSGKAGGADNGNFKEVRTIIFENPHGNANEHSNFQSAQGAIKDTAKTLTTEASSQSAGKFAQLVRILRTTSKDDLIKLFNQFKGHGLEKRVFLDGLLRAGTGYSIEASIEILKSKELNPIEQNLVYLSLGNARHVNNEAVKAAATLLDQPNIPKEVYLGVGALGGAYCRGHNCHTGKADGVAALTQKLSSKLNCKAKSKTEEDVVIAVLKGIRNIRHLEDSIIDKLAHCISDNNVKSRVKVAALEAIHADPCTSKLHKLAIDTMKNRQLDSEIRIKAYLAVIECPCGKSATEIKNLLDSEPVHQVGRFISSSLRHIRASTNPDKYLQRQHYSQIHTPNKFNIDDRKYSFYRELSYNVDALGIGGNLEETVIYSQDSFLPRSANLNLTAELFGHSLNIFEVGGRQGNLDRVAEHLLGPKGILRSQKPQDIYDTIVKQFMETEEKVHHSLSRGRRSVKSEIDNFDKHIKAESTPYNNELDLDIYIKLFGTDAVFLSLGDDKGFDLNRLLEQTLSSLNGGIDKLKHFKEEIRAHLLFLDAQLSYPTSTGLPLRLDLVGSATGRLDIATNVDLRQIYRSPQNAKVDIKLVPSTDIEISGLFLVDADSVATGLKVVTNLHSSTGGHLIAKVLENGQGIDLQFGLPIDKQEILTASNDLIYFTAEKGQLEKQIPLKVDTDRKEYSGCFDQLSGVLGLTMCGELSVPFSVSGPDAQASISKFIARYPLTGSSKVKLVLEKNDLKGYHIKGVIRENPERRGFELLLDVEGSKNRRTQVAGELINNKEEKTIKLSLESPIKSASAQISLYTKSNEFAALVKAEIDQLGQYYGRVGFNVQGNEQRSVYKPVIEYQIPGEGGNVKQSLKVDGQVIREINGPTTKYSLEGIKVNVPNTNEVIDMNGHYIEEPKGREIDIKAKRGEHNLALVGSLKGHDVKIEFQNTLNPFVNFRVTGHFECGEVTHNDLDIVYGENLQNSKNRIIINQLLKYKNEKKTAEDFSIITKNKFEIQALPIKAKLDAEVDSKRVDIEIEGQYLEKKAAFDLEARTHIKKPEDYSVKIIANFDKNGVEVFAKRDIISADKSNLENYISIKNLGKYELSGIVNHKNKPNDVHIGAIGHLKISGSGNKNEDIKFDIAAVQNEKLYSSHAKIGASKGEILDYLIKITRGKQQNGQLKFNLKDTISANGQFKVVDDNGKGNGAIIIDFKKAERKIKGDFKFLVKDPVFNAEFDVFLNFEKDNSDKLRFTTQTKKTDRLIDSKNKLDYAGKKTEVNVHADGSTADSGKTRANVEIVLPNDRYLSLKLDRDLTISKDSVYNGHAEITLTDAIKRGGAASVFNYKGKVIDTDLEKERINYEGQLTIKLKEGKNLQNTFSLKNIPAGDKAKFDFKSDITGSLIPKPVHLLAHSEYSSLEGNLDVFDVYRYKGSYGDDIGVEVTGKTDIKYFGTEDKKYLDDYTISLRLPLENAHDIKIVSNVLFIEPKEKTDDKAAEFTIIESLQVNADLYKVDASGTVGPKSGSTKLKAVVPHVDPVSFEVKYKNDLGGEKKAAKVELGGTYGKGKTAHIDVEAFSSSQDYGVKIKAVAPNAEKLKKLEIDLKTKLPSSDSVSSSVIVDADGKVYKSEGLIVYSKAHPVVDLKYSCPDNTAGSRLYVKGTSLSSSQGKVEVKVDNIREVSLDATAEGNIQKDNVNLKLQATSEKLGLKNYNVDISSKDAGSGKRLEFKAVNDNKNILSGSTSFISKQEGPKTIIEGSGSVKVKDEQKSANFKYIRTVLTEGNEQGVETFLNLAIGDRSYVAESRVTNLEYKNSYVYCEEKKQCAHAEIQSKLNVQKAGVFQHLLNVGIDLRKLGLAPEFGLQVSNEFSEKRLPQYSLDLHVNKEENKYHVHVYSQPKHGEFPAGIKVTLPHRVLAIESLVTYPTNKALPFPIKAEIALHPDKNKPQHKSGARLLVDVTGGENQHAAIAELGFSHPKLGKEATIKFSGQFQRPNENTYKFETKSSISHPTLGGDRESTLLLEVSPIHVKVLAVTPIAKIVSLEGKANLKDNLQQASLTFSLLEGKPVQVTALAKDFQFYEFTTGYSDEAERKLSITGHLEPEKRIEISANIVLPGEKKNIVHGALFLQDNLVKSDYGISKENFNYFVNAFKNDLSNLENRIKELGDKASNDFKATLKKVEPTLKQIEKSYEEDLEKLYKEVSDDKVLQDVGAALSIVAKTAAKIITEVTEYGKAIVEEINKAIKKFSDVVIDLYEKKIEPQVKELYQNVSAVVKEYLDGLLDLVAHFAALFTDFFEKHKPELQELTNTLAEIFKDLTRLLVAQLKEFRTRVGQVFNDVTQQIKELPIIGMIKEKYQELAVPESVLGILLEGHQTIRQLLPTEETKNLADALYNYAQKKLKQEKVDDTAELRVIYEKLAVAMTSLLQFVRGQINQLGIPTLINFNALPIFSGPGKVTAPSFGGVASFSLLNQILKGDIPDPLSVIKAYRPKSINPLDEVPAKLRAVVVNGQHIFTFDGRHLTFPGTCRYVLAHDHVDRNFTLAIQLQNGAPKALILEDKSGSVIELKENGQVTLNGVVHGYPVMEKDSFAFKQPNGRIGVGTLYGLMAFCSPKLEVCYIDISGFYLGKLRGLLGDGNNEPYDDFRLPNGKIVQSESEFGNAYKLAGSCPAAKTPEHSAHQHHATLPPACEQVFGASSPLRPLALVLDVAPFRQACIHAVTDDSANALAQACDLARGYTALAVNVLLPAVLPRVCVQCTDTDKTREIGDTYEMILPNKQADIIVTVETTKNNEKTFKELVVPLVAQVVDNLKAQKIDDIKIILVGITSKFPYPIVYDTDLKLKNAKVQFDDESRYNKLPRIKTNNDKLNEYEEQVITYIESLQAIFHLTNVEVSYKSLLDLPVRPSAVKHIVYTLSEHCLGIAPLTMLRALTYNIIYENNAMTFTLFSPALKDTDDQCRIFADAMSDAGAAYSPEDYFGKPAEQKQFLKATSRNIVSRMTQNTMVQECTCTYVDSFRARSVCINKETKEGHKKK